MKALADLDGPPMTLEREVRTADGYSFFFEGQTTIEAALGNHCLIVVTDDGEITVHPGE
jgi:hypothetical protein